MKRQRGPSKAWKPEEPLEPETSPLQLYTGQGTKGVLCEWYLKEVGLDAEMIRLDRTLKEQRSDSFREVNPFMRLPTLVDGDLRLAESGAILLYLADKYGGLNTPEDRAVAAKWVFFGQTTLMDVFFVEDQTELQPDTLQALEEVVASRDYLIGSRFSVADAAVGHALRYIDLSFTKVNFSSYPSIQEYMKRINGRAAYQSART
ncbi:hypothetical protein WJX73_001854 [Symbiochloris irregularis]|uniref:Glutathione S-transferase n=1 Tax=Symbiochloris irregularis TaxID=706552 RepID=A0AAW1NUW6_9CHLO